MTKLIDESSVPVVYEEEQTPVVKINMVLERILRSFRVYVSDL
jgi:hypothetical protein